MYYLLYLCGIKYIDMAIDNKKIADVIALINNSDSEVEFGSGGKIHIKKKNRGKFTALLKRTGKSASWYKAHGTPAQKKMAVFALNARKWKHDDGGFLRSFDLGGDKKERARIDSVTQKILQEANARELADVYTGKDAPTELPLQSEDWKFATALAGGLASRSIPSLATGNIAADNGIAKALTWWGEKAMPSALLGNGALGEAADAAMLSYWSAKGLDSAKKALGDKNPLGAAGIGLMAAMPFVGPAKQVVNAVAPYVIERFPGYMLRSLMAGNPLEKQISKAGTVNVNNIRAIANKANKMEQSVINKVLSSDEFAGKAAVDYNKFRQAVQKELIIYDKAVGSSLPYTDYGMGRLGFKVAPDPAGSSLPGIVEGAEPKTILLESPRIPKGDSRHYYPNTLGHIRTYTTADEPDILHVMESQSDWAQNAQAYYPSLRHDAEAFLMQHPELPWRVKMLRRRGNEAQSLFTDGEQMFTVQDVDNLYPGWRKSIIDEESKIRPQVEYLQDNYTIRQLQENLKYAAEKGQKKMRYPTRETAAKVEGYSKSRSQTLQDNPELQGKYDDLRAELREAENAVFQKYAPKDYLDESMRDVDFEDMGLSEKQIQERLAQEQRSVDFDNSPEGKKMREEILEVRKKIDPDKWLRDNVPEVYLPEHETILRKYDAFPKQYQKLFKNSEVRTVVDPKGNTWYEVDVPKDYLNMEWQFAEGGPMNLFWRGGPDKPENSVETYQKLVNIAPYLYYGPQDEKEPVVFPSQVPEYQNPEYSASLPEITVTAPLPEKFNGSQAAAQRYAEGYQFGRDVVKEGIEKNGVPLAVGALAIPGTVIGGLETAMSPAAFDFLGNAVGFEYFNYLPKYLGANRSMLGAAADAGEWLWRNYANQGFSAGAGNPTVPYATAQAPIAQMTQEQIDKTTPYVRGASEIAASIPLGALANTWYNGFKLMVDPSNIGALKAVGRFGYMPRTQKPSKAVDALKSFYDDFSWNRNRALNWIGERGNRLDERQFLRGLTDSKVGGPYSGTKADMQKDARILAGRGYTEDSMDRGLIGRYVEENYPEVQEEMIRRNTARMNRNILDNVDFYEAQDPEVLEALRGGDYTYQDALQAGKIKLNDKGRSGAVKSGLDADTKHRLRLESTIPRSDIWPRLHSSNINNYPITTDFSGLVGKTKSVLDTRDWVYDELQRIYNSGEGVTSRIGTLNKDVPKIMFTDTPLSTSRNWNGKGLDIGFSDLVGNNTIGGTFSTGMFTPHYVVAHEGAHNHPVFNNKAAAALTEESPYYGNSYADVPSRYRELLVGDTRRGPGFVNEHDKELSEHFSDLWGLRADMRALGVNKGDRPYTIEQLRRLNNMFSSNKGSFGNFAFFPGVSTTRYQYYHPIEEQVVEGLNTVKSKGGPLGRTMEGGGFIWEPNVSLQQKVAPPVPYKLPEVTEDGSVVGFSDISADIVNGAGWLYKKNLPKDVTFYKDNNSDAIFARFPDAGPLNLSDFTEVPYSSFSGNLPKRDYIGGSNYRIETAKKIPGLFNMISEKADSYGVDPNLMLHRLLKEGFIDQAVRFYNDDVPASAQKDYWNHVAYEPVNGFDALGLDDAATHLMEGKYSLKNDKAGWEEIEAENEKGRSVHSVMTQNLPDALEVLAAEMAYRQNELKKRGISPEMLGAYTNAAFNMGLYNDKLKDSGYVTSHYTYPNYYDKYGLSNTFASGGTVSEVWKDKTGLDWSEVGNYYPEYDKSLEGNIKLLGQLQSGKYDYIKNGGSTPMQQVQMPVFQNPNELSPEQVMQVQGILKSKGYDIGTYGKDRSGVDGIFGPQTTKAFQQYLSDTLNSGSLLSIDGKFGSETSKAAKIVFEQQPSASAAEITASAQKPILVDEPVFADSIRSSVAVDSTGVGSRASNIGQLYNPRYDNLQTVNGVNLSNIYVPDDKLVAPQYSAAYANGMRYADMTSAAALANKAVDGGKEQRCSAFVQKAIAENCGWDYCRSNGMNGDAWMIGDNMVRKGGQRYFNIFAGTKDDANPCTTYLCNRYGKKSYKDFSGVDEGRAQDIGRTAFSWVKKRFAANKDQYMKDIMDNVHEGDIVELMYYGSPHSAESVFDSKGKRASTHVGYICSIGGEYYIQDNTSGHVHNRKLSDVLGGKDSSVFVAGLIRPASALSTKKYDVSAAGRSATDLGDFGVYRTKESGVNYHRFDNDVAYRTMGTLYNNKDVLSKELKLTPDEYNLLSGVVHCITFKESTNGEFEDNSKYLNKKGASLMSQYGKDAVEGADTTTSALNQLLRYGMERANENSAGLLSEFTAKADSSLGVSQLKVSGLNSPLTDYQREMLGVEGMQAMKDTHPETSAVAAMYAMSNNYKILQDAIERYNVPEEVLTKENIGALLAKMYNEGAAIAVQSLSNAYAEGQETGDMVGAFENKLEAMDTPYTRGFKTLFSYHDYDLFDSEDRDAYYAATEEARQASEQAILDAVSSDISLLPAVMTLIRNMPVKQARRYGAAAANDKDTVSAYKSGNLSVKADSIRDLPARNAYMRSFKKAVKKQG